MTEPDAPRPRLGRPKADEGPRLPPDDVVRLLVEGELVTTEDGRQRRVWPSQRAIAARYGVSHSRVGVLARQHDCARRRALLQSDRAALGQFELPAECASPAQRHAPSRKTPRDKTMAHQARIEAHSPAPCSPPPAAAAPAAPQRPAEAPLSASEDPFTPVPPSSPPQVPSLNCASSEPEPDEDATCPPPPANSSYPDQDYESPHSRRRAGRPRRSEAPDFRIEDLDRLLVHGQVQLDESGNAVTSYPSYRQLAERFGVSAAYIADYVTSHNCIKRRKAARVKLDEAIEQKLLERRANAIAVTKDDVIRMIDDFLLQFREAVQDGRVRSDNPADVNTLVRLKAFVLGGADSRQEVHAQLSLESIQQRHARMLQAQREHLDAPLLTGAIDTTGTRAKLSPLESSNAGTHEADDDA
jgi:hypothetical protein